MPLGGTEILMAGDAPPDDRGLYILWLELPRPVRIRVGALGVVDMPAGLYAYVGTAQRRRSARIARHLKAHKPVRWHIDYVRPYARVAAVSLLDGDRSKECVLARRVRDALGARVAVPRFGASDCRCTGHLLLIGEAVAFDRGLHEKVHSATAVD